MKRSTCAFLFAGLLIAVSAIVSGAAAPMAVAAEPASQGDIRMVLVMTRHGVRSPTHPDELKPYASRPWPAWNVQPGHLTPHGADLMRQFGQYYRRQYGAAVSATDACPVRDAVFVWADTDQRTLATGQALLDGFAPGCTIAVNHATAKTDTLFDPIPGVGTVDVARSKASVLGSIGGDPNSLKQAYGQELRSLEAVLGCTATTVCKAISSVPSSVNSDGDGGLADIGGGIDLAAGATGNLFLEYVDGHKVVGWGKVDAATLLDLLKLRAVKSRLVHGNPYTARVHSSNILTHIAETLSQGASGQRVAGTRVPSDSHVVFIVGHDTQMAELAGMLQLSWLAPNAQINDTPPGGALVFEVHAPPAGTNDPFVRLFFDSQTMNDMRAGNGSRPNAVPVYIPGCPSLDCPMATFTRIVDGAVDKSFVTPWK